MGFLFNKRNKGEKLVAIFDIGSDSVGGAIAKISTDGKYIPHIIKSVRSEILFHEEADLNILLKNMLLALNSTATILHDAKMGAFDEIFCVMASPWYLSENRLVKMSKEHSFIFTEKIADELLQKEILALTETYKKKYPDVDSKLELMEHHIMDVSLNGYKVTTPLGMQSKSIEMNMVVSLSSKTCLDKIRETLSKLFHSTPVSFSSFMVASYLAVRDKYVSPSSYLLLDVGGEITEVGIVSKGILMSSLSFPFGKKTFYRYMCTKLNIDIRDAKELFNMFITGALSEKRKVKVVPLFESIEKSWGEAFRECVNTLPHSLALPSTIFLTADDDIRKWFADTINNEEYSPTMITKYKSEVITLDGPEFLNMCNVSNGTCDPFLMIEAIAVARKQEKK